MSIAIVTGSAGLIGSETCRRFSREGFDIAGIDNDMRSEFFGAAASTLPSRKKLESELSNYTHNAVDIRDGEKVDALFARHGTAVKAVIHTLA